MALPARITDTSAPPFVIAEAGVNHNGDLRMALMLVDAAADAGADAVKFQTFRANSLATRRAELADYQRQAGETGVDQVEMLRRLELSGRDHESLAKHSADRGLTFLSTPFDIESARMLLRLEVPLLKVPSGELDNIPFLQHLADLGLPLIVSTGMGTLGEVEEAVGAIQDRWRQGGTWHGLVLLHCTSCYPARPDEANLRAMQTMHQAFGLPVGYSDHTEGIQVALAATALGARVVEKHFTLDRSLPGPDHKASLEPDALKAMIEAIRAVHSALGSAVKAPTEREAEVRRVARRSLVASRDLLAGALLEPSMLAARRPATSLSPRFAPLLFGRRLARSLAADEPVRFEDLAPQGPDPEKP